ncbi:MAG: hypothetical protein ACI9G5_000236 [Paracoccaceae bacterium]|jgi:hypothetical protein
MKYIIMCKLKASFVHGLITILVAAVTACVVYLLWYPGEFANMVGGTELYWLVLAVEVCLGPLMSLVIFNPKKPRAELIRDYCVIALIQLTALGYGLHTVMISRPVFLVFVKDRIEVVSAVELSTDDLATAKDEMFQRLSWFGPVSVCTESPVDPKERSDILLSALHGKDIELMPAYYRSCAKAEVYEKAYTKEQLFSLTETLPEKLPKNVRQWEFRWLPVKTRFGAWIALYPSDRNFEPFYLEVDPFAIEENRG